jgi:hypothetical protein
MLLMGKSIISIGPFSIDILVYQGINPIKIPLKSCKITNHPYGLMLYTQEKC